jgi:hypothetical protein
MTETVYWIVVTLPNTQQKKAVIDRDEAFGVINLCNNGLLS